MNLKRRTFMQSTMASLASLFGLEAAEEMLGPRKVMVPGMDLKKFWRPSDPIGDLLPPDTREVIDEILHKHYRTPRDRYNPIAGALQQELIMGEKGRWRTGDWMGREGASVGDLFAKPSNLPIGCSLGPRAKLVHVDEARKTLRFELAPSRPSGDYYERADIGGWPLE